MCLMTYHLFDQFVNKDNYPEAYRKGLSNEQDYVDEGFDDEFEGE